MLERQIPKQRIKVDYDNQKTMPNYDFQKLEANEFECLVRDLLQAREGLFVDSFAPGPDGGIDLRFAYSKDKQCVVQCKRYATWNSLKSVLEKEVDKVKRLKPNRYIIATSVDLTPANKNEIKQMFGKFIKSKEKDILSKSNINDLLGLHEEVEKRHYKLWLTSTTVLNSILNRDVENWSLFERENACEDIKHYVMNQSFDEAKRIVEQNHFVVISGIPGIGKTTLARALAFDLLANGYEDFISVSRDLNGIAKMFQEGKRQVFLFDDFLGSTQFIDDTKNFDSDLSRLIEVVRRSKDKILILTTREYILNDARKVYEKLDDQDLNIAKYIINMETYSPSIRANILYNQLIQYDIPDEYLTYLVTNKHYNKILTHKGFNPRVIAAYLKTRPWTEYAPKEFLEEFERNFDNPLSVWEKAFGRMSMETRYAMLVMATMGGCVLLSEWEDAFRHFSDTCPRLGLHYDGQIWSDTLKTLDNCFIQTNKSKFGIIAEYYNPSVKDYIESYIARYPDVIRNLITAARYVDQLLLLFSDHESKIVVPADVLNDVILDKFLTLFDKGETCIVWNNKFSGYMHGVFSPVEKLNRLSHKYDSLLEKHPGLFESLVKEEHLRDEEESLSDRIELLRNADVTKLSFNYSEIIDLWTHDIDLDLDDAQDLIELCNCYYIPSCRTAEFKRIIDDLIDEAVRNIGSDSDADEIRTAVDNIEKNLVGWHPSSCLDEDIDYALFKLEARYYESALESKGTSQCYDTDMENVRVDEIMTSLLDR